MTKDDKQNWSVSDIAKHIGVSRSTVHRFIREDRLAVYDTGGKYIATNDDVERLLQDLKVPSKQAVVRLQD